MLPAAAAQAGTPGHGILEHRGTPARLPVGRARRRAPPGGGAPWWKPAAGAVGRATTGGPARWYTGRAPRGRKKGSVLLFGTDKRAVAALDALYQRDPGLFAEGLEQMRERQIELGNLYGGHPIPSVPSPLLMDRAAMAPVLTKVRRLRRLLEAAATRLVAEDSFPSYFDTAPLHGDLIRASATRPGRVAPVARIDGMLSPRGRLQVIEVNTDGSTGIHDAFALGESARGSAPLRRLATRYRLRASSLYRPLARCFVDLWRAAGKDGAPRVALLDWEHVKTRYEQEILARELTRLGVPTVRADPRALTRRRGVATVEGGRVDIVYKRVLTAELLDRPAEVAGYLEAVLAGDVLQLDPFTADLIYDKGMLALLHQPGWSDWLRPAARRLVDELVPFTRFFPGDEALERRALKDRKDLVLKPRNEYGGKGVVLGNRATARAWKDALHAGAAAGKHLLQAFVTPTPHDLWVPAGARGVASRTMHSILGIWLFGEATPGYYFRAGPNPVINVSGGAYGVPVLHAARR